VIKYCSNCNMNFSESFEKCPCCEGKLAIRDLSTAETIEPDILKMTDEELLSKYRDYLKSIRNQGCQMTDKDFVDGLRAGRKNAYRNASTTILEEHPSNPTITCPYCKSTDCKKVSCLSKAGSVALWWIFALGKATKRWHCNKCKSDF